MGERFKALTCIVLYWVRVLSPSATPASSPASLPVWVFDYDTENPLSGSSYHFLFLFLFIPTLRGGSTRVSKQVTLQEVRLPWVRFYVRVNRYRRFMLRFVDLSWRPDPCILAFGREPGLV